VNHRHGQRGQALFIFVIALVALIAMTGLILDGGAVFAQQRVAQNGADGAATAGTVVIASNLGDPGLNDGSDVWTAIDDTANDNGLESWTAIYTDVYGDPIGADVVNTGAIPTDARGVRVSGKRTAATSFARVIGVNSLPANADATVIAGALSLDCVVAEDGCTLLPLTFPVQVSECDSRGELIEGPWIGAPPPDPENVGDEYWPIVGAGDLPTATDPDGNEDTLAILPLCKSSSTGSGAFGWLDLDPSIPNLPGEIEGPLTNPVDIPDWFQTQSGNPNSVDDEISAYIHQPVLIPLNNGACREDPGTATICPAGMEGVDPVGNNTWYYVHTLAVFYIHQVLVQGPNVDECASPPGGPPVPVTRGSGFLGCIKGWFVNYVTSGPVDPEGEIGPGGVAIQLIR
jgi:Putative Flp pilus-assembly TadE/G-like